MSEPIKLSEEDRKKLVDLYERAQRTPMIALSMQDGLEGRDFASLAWKDVKEFMDELAKKYGYDPKNNMINAQTGEVATDPFKVTTGEKDTSAWVCEVCGCTDTNPCKTITDEVYKTFQTCSWVRKNLCSACVGKQKVKE